LLPALLAGFVAACSGGGEGDSKGTGTTTGRGESAAGDAAALPEAQKGTSSIEGKVTFTGSAQPDANIEQADMAATDPWCGQHHPEGPVALQEIVVSPNGEVADVFVYVKEGAQASRPSADKATLDQQNCLYVPKVLGLQTNQPLLITTSDETPHNVNTQPANNRGFNRGFAQKGQTFETKFPNAETLIQFKCDIHPWMYAYAGVVPHPFFAVSGKDGNFQIPNLPAGTYTLEAVHKKLGTQSSQAITVADGESQTVSFAFQAAGG
jgi:hypothetical protein